MPSPTAITVSQLSRLIGTPLCPILIDVRIAEDVDSDPRAILSSYRHPFNDIRSLASQLHTEHVVIICHKGKKISQGAAAILRELSVNAEFLEGGHVAWTEKKLPTMSITQLDTISHKKSTLWVTRHRPKIDRIACPWLIKRFIDRSATFLFVEPSQVLAVAEKFHAIPFDVEGVHYSHQDDQCTFDRMLTDFQITNEPLKHLATIIRGADTGRHELSPESAGLLSISLGFSRMYKDDLEQLNACLPVYDALYRWCRDATNEKHDWSMHQSNSNKTHSAS